MKHDKYKAASIHVLDSYPLSNRKEYGLNDHHRLEHVVKIRYNDIEVIMGVGEFDELHEEDNGNFYYNRIIKSNVPDKDYAHVAAFNFWDKMNNRIVNAIKKDKEVKSLKPKTRQHFGEIIREL
jgi:hypothetical protein